MHWYFGYGAGLDFKNGSPAPDTTGNMYFDEACFTMSDTCGNLLFYGNPDTIFNKNHLMMDNGDLIPPSLPFVNPTEMVCIPQPGNDSLFYLFYTTDGTYFNKLFYAIINIKENEGLGSVISKDNILLDTLVSEKVAAVKHCNGTDYWITGKRGIGIAPNYLGASELFTWLLTESGINTTPVISDIGKRFFELNGGNFKFSPNGSKAAEVVMYPDWISMADSSYFQLYDFDDCTGIFSNPVLIPFPCPYGIAFSLDNTKLYTAVYSECVVDTFFLAQYDISNYDSTAIVNSKFILRKGNAFAYDGMQLAIDGKIYVCDWDTTDLFAAITSSQNLGVISNPNASGLACNYYNDTVFLGGKMQSNGLPDFVDSFFSSFIYQNCDIGIREIYSDDIIMLYPNPANDFLNIQCNRSGNIEIKIYNITGKLCMEKTISGENTVLDINSFSSGLYFIQLNLNNNHSFINLKFIKL